MAEAATRGLPKPCGVSPLNIDETSTPSLSQLRDFLLQWRQKPSGDDAADALDSIEFLMRLLGPAVCRRLGIFRLPENFLLSVVIAVYNEVDTLDEVIKRVRDCGIRCELIVVDDGSTDGTRALLERYRGQDDFKLILHETNQGKGAASKPALPTSVETWC